MEFLGITSSQNVEKLFEQNELKNIFKATFTDKLPIRIGYSFIDNLFVFRFLAIQMDNSYTYETFEVFDMDSITTNSFEDMIAIACTTADKIVEYNKRIVRHYKEQQIL